MCALKASEEGSIALSKKEYRGHERAPDSANQEQSAAATRKEIQAQAEEGRKWLEQAAALGNPEAKNNLGDSRCPLSLPL